jgi:sialate O-acetylesterase
MKKCRIIQFLFLLLILNLCAFADIKLPSVISSGMVLQQKSTVNIWGWASKGEKITVKADWNKSVVSTTADENGKWLVKIKTTKACGPYKITIKGNNEIVLDDILLGEVWLCSGQSNMEYTLKMLGGWKQFDKEKADLEKNDYSKIRFCQVQKTVALEPQDTCVSKWLKTNLQNAEGFSGTAYFYGKELYNKLKVPIGLITSSWGGTPAQAWTQKEYFKDELNFYLEQPTQNPPSAGMPSVLYNAMINPIKNYTIKGAIWYQGEANRGDADHYYTLITTMIKNWRAVWNQGDFPFYFVQIAPYTYGDCLGSSGFLRETQFKTLSLKNTGMAVTMDIGNLKDIHPKNKQDVGKRLALWAFAKTYNIKIPSCSGPIYTKMAKEGDKIRLYFDHVDGGLLAKYGKLDNFIIAGKDMNFIPAEASIDNNSVIVFNEKIKEPAAVRYAFGELDTATLFNKEGLPASSFRTDNEPFIFRRVKTTLYWDSINNVTKATMVCYDKTCKIYYSLDESVPTESSSLYSDDFMLDKTCKIKARVYQNNTASTEIVETQFKKHLGLGKTITVKNNVPETITAGKYVLLNGVKGSLDASSGTWQGYEGNDFEATVDLGDTININKISTDFLQKVSSYIFLPTLVEHYASKDGKEFKKISEFTHDEPLKKSGPFIKNFTSNVNNEKYRYIKVKAKNIGVCPEWHFSAGRKAWLFIDEIVVE